MSEEIDTCSCKKVKCKRHGKCEECMAYHCKKDQLPRCKQRKISFGNLFIIKSS